jgi:hypothetical protein
VRTEQEPAGDYRGQDADEGCAVDDGGTCRLLMPSLATVPPSYTVETVSAVVPRSRARTSRLTRQNYQAQRCGPRERERADRSAMGG